MSLEFNLSNRFGFARHGMVERNWLGNVEKEFSYDDTVARQIWFEFADIFETLLPNFLPTSFVAAAPQTPPVAQHAASRSRSKVWGRAYRDTPVCCPALS